MPTWPVGAGSLTHQPTHQLNRGNFPNGLGPNQFRRYPNYNHQPVIRAFGFAIHVRGVLGHMQKI
jgi:hypothetical protein